MMKVQRGEERITKSKIIPNKTFNAQTSCRCKRNCSQYIDESRQKGIFNSFYNLRNWTEKTLFLRTLAKRFGAKENLSPMIKLKNRQFSNKYYLFDNSGKQHQVCLGFLLIFLQINKQRMCLALNTVVSNEPASDNRHVAEKQKKSMCPM